MMAARVSSVPSLVPSPLSDDGGRYLEKAGAAARWFQQRRKNGMCKCVAINGGTQENGGGY
jgi:hypothetical protein